MVVGGLALIVVSFTVHGAAPICDGAALRDGETCKVSGERLTAADVEQRELDAVTGFRVMGGVALAAGVLWFAALDPKGRVRHRHAT
jgi:hypothetical protein